MISNLRDRGLVDLESDPRQLEYARTLALPQTLSLDFSPAVLTSILGSDPPQLKSTGLAAMLPYCAGAVLWVHDGVYITKQGCSNTFP